MNILEPVDNPEVRYHSSISQHKNKLGVMKQGEWVPIKFDSIDYIGCNGVHSTEAVLALGDDLGYNFPVGKSSFTEDTYLTTDVMKDEVRPLPEEFGEGNYTKHIEGSAFTNFSNSALGHRDQYNLRVGLHYATADETLKAVE